jgi:GNAT superfamily N-acetyltransferase
MKASTQMAIQHHHVDPAEPTHIQAITQVWNEACGPNLSISERFVRFNVGPNTGGSQAGLIALEAGRPVGVVLVSRLQGEPLVRSADKGWIDALVVLPSAQHQGIGTRLLAWGEQWLKEQGCHSCVLGTSLRPFTPGVPAELGTVPFFQHNGYVEGRTVWDMAANLAYYQSPPTVRKIDGVVRPARAGDGDALLEFLRREFPGRWRYETEESLRDPAFRFSDYMLLWTDRGVDGFCRLTFEDSRHPIERYFPYGLPRPWGQLGTVGVSADRRGRGYGAALLDAGLRRLHDNGVNGCVIDWLVIVDFYAKFGFTTHREYRQMEKTF